VRKNGETTTFEQLSSTDWSASYSRALIAAAHELKDPLASLRFMLQCMNANFNDESTIEQYRKKASLLSEQMLRTVDGLLEGYRLRELSSQQLLFTSEPLNLRAETERALHELQPYADEYQQKLILKSVNKQHIVVANKNILNKILFQLTHNMLRSNQGGSEVALSFHQQKRTNTSCIMVSGDQFLTGSNWVNRSTTRMGKASHSIRNQLTSGLDLFVAQTLAEGMGGTLGIAQKQGRQTYQVRLLSSQQLDLLGMLS
jgi:signal transduction histidine kinase